MCDFCRNKKKIIDGKGNLVLLGAENNMIFDNSDGKEVAGAVKLIFALCAVESWWKNERNYFIYFKIRAGHTKFSEISSIKAKSRTKGMYPR